MTTNAIKVALQTDFATITGIGTNSLEPVFVEDFDTGTAGGIAMLATEGGDELQSFNDDAGACEHVFTLQAVTFDSNAPNKASDDFLDAIRNAVEKKGSAVRLLTTGGVSKVEEATVSDWDEAETIPSIHEGWYIREVDVTVKYYYQRGSA